MKAIRMITEKNEVRDKVPIWKKLLLTVDEASQYSGIGMHRLRDMLDDDDCTFVIRKGSHKLVKRKEFETFISNAEIV